MYGYRTAQAVREFQRKNGLAVDGITGTSTWSALGYAAEKKQNVSTLYWNSRGNDVVKVQQKLSQWGYYDGTVDGIYGYRTAQAVREFQGKNGLTVDGVTGSSTWSALGYSAGPQVTSTSTGYNASRSYQDKTYLLAKVISGEARGEPYLGKVAVGAVIMNRVQSAAFPDTIPGVIYQYLAFEAVSNGQYNRVPEKESYLAAQQSIAGWDPTYGCLYYWNPVKSSSQWIWSRNITMRIGEHVFGV
ncbi:MAG: spore cortex-lytic enzyme [Clostridiales bacterium]|nr:spore cortex-lytic enzyme [Clostridiales bacterium]MCF8022217.1 spore cortex-lytic enzyme [Clostridiales bacterium]